MPTPEQAAWMAKALGVTVAAAQGGVSSAVRANVDKAGSDKANVDKDRRAMRVKLQFARNRVEAALERYFAQKKINDEHWIVSGVSSAVAKVKSLGDFKDPGAELAAAQQKAFMLMTSGLSAAGNGDLTTAAARVAEIEALAQTASRLARAYCDGVIDGAEGAVAVLEVADKAGDVAQAGLDVAMPGVGTALSVGKKTAVVATRWAIGDDIDWGLFTIDIALELILFRFGDKASSKIVGGLAKSLAGKASGQFTKKAIESAVKGLVLHEGSTVLRTTVEQVYAAARGKPLTVEQFFDQLAKRMSDPAGLAVSLITSTAAAGVEVRLKPGSGGAAAEPGPAPAHGVDPAAPKAKTRAGPADARETSLIGSIADHNRQGLALRDGAGKRVSESEHIWSKANIVENTRNPKSGESPYDQAAYDESTTLKLSREAALEKTRGDNAALRRLRAEGDSPSPEAVREAGFDAAVERTKAAVKKAGDPISDEQVELAAHGQMGTLHRVGRPDVKDFIQGLSPEEFRKLDDMIDSMGAPPDAKSGGKK